MFSLIALYLEYRKAQSVQTAATSTAAQRDLPANDADAIGVAKAA